MKARQSQEKLKDHSLFISNIYCRVFLLTLAFHFIEDELNPYTYLYNITHSTHKAQTTQTTTNKLKSIFSHVAS